jgi:hypothetical protein
MTTRTGRKAAETRAGATVPERRERRGGSSATEKLRRTYGLSRPLLARMLGLTDRILARGEKEGGPGGTDRAAKIRRVAKILKGLAQVMRASYIPTWLEAPNPACAEIGVGAPVELMERGHYETIEGMIFFLGSGVPT